MEKELDLEVIKSTQLSLGKYVKRPPLNEKLLRKPPFRFLHDIISSVLKSTGFFGNLFEAEELTSDNVKDRDSKIAFLNKVIFVLSTTTGKSISAKPSKIVAGQEPEKTNELLQCLAQALDDKLSSDAAVKKYKESINSSNVTDNKSKDSNKKSIETKKSTSKSGETINQKNDSIRLTNKQDKNKINDTKPKRKESSSSKIDSSKSKTIGKKNSKESVKDDNTTSRNNKIVSNNNMEKEKTPSASIKPDSEDLDLPLELEDQMGARLIVNDDSTNNTETYDQENLNASYNIVDNDLNSSASTNELIETQNTITEPDKPPENNIGNETSLSEKQPHIKKPTIVNQKIMKQNNQESPKKINMVAKSEVTNGESPSRKDIVKVPASSESDTYNFLRPPSVRPSSSRPGAPRMREKVDSIIKDPDNLLLGKVNIIVENTQNEEEEDVNLMIMEQQDDPEIFLKDQGGQISSNEHGHLVQQILDSQKKLSQMTGKTEIEWQFGVQKAREAVNQEVEQLKYNVQALSRVTNPLRKLLDHVQEDVEVMRQELQQWTTIYDDVSKEVLKQKTVNEDFLMPFHTKLTQLESDIEEKHNKINDLKVLVHKNALKIEKLLTNGNVQ